MEDTKIIVLKISIDKNINSNYPTLMMIIKKYENLTRVIFRVSFNY